MRGARFGVSVCCTAALAAQTDWELRGAAARVRLDGPERRWLQGPRAFADGLPAGSYAVHFGADADGKPRSLAIDVPDGASVFVATDAAAAAASEALQLGAAVAGMRCDPAVEASSYRVEATVEPGAGAVALLARCSGPEHFYRFVWDRAAQEFRLERAFAGPVRVAARAAAPAADQQPHTLALQVEGFRIQASFDEAVVLQQLDGGVSTGAPGTWSELPEEAPIHAVHQPVASARASAALVTTAQSATLQAATTVVPGHWYVLELALERGQPPLPRTEGGLEAWLLLPPAAPVVLQADWTGSLATNAVGEVRPDGLLACELRWPAFPVLRKACLQVRALLVAPNGQAINDRTPAVRLLVP